MVGLLRGTELVYPTLCVGLLRRAKKVRSEIQIASALPQATQQQVIKTNLDNYNLSYTLI